MKSIGKLLNKKLKQLQRPANLDDKTVFYVFKKVIQEEFGNIGAEKFRPEYFGNKVLAIKSDSSAWASELWLNKGKIIRKLNKELGEGSVEKIKVN